MNHFLFFVKWILGSREKQTLVFFSVSLHRGKPCYRKKSLQNGLFFQLL